MIGTKVDGWMDGWILEIVAQACSIFTEPLRMIGHLPTSVTKSCFSVVWGLCLVMATFVSSEAH